METLNLYKVNRPEYTAVNIAKRIRSTERVGRVQAIVGEGSGAKTVSLIHKSPDYMQQKPDGTPVQFDDYAQTYGEIWLALKEARIPTVPTLRIATDSLVLMTDLEADGSRLFDKVSYRNYHPRRSPISESDRRFLATETDEIIESAGVIMDRATQAKIVLPIDSESLSLLMREDGSWKLLVVDFEYALFNNEAAGFVNELNLRDFTKFIRNYKTKIKQGLDQD